MNLSVRRRRHWLLALSSMLLAIALTHCVSGVDPAPPAAGAGGSRSTSSGSGLTVGSSSAAGSTGNANSSSSSVASSASSSVASSASSSVASSASSSVASSASSSGSGMGGGPSSSSSAAGSGGAGGMGTHCLENIPANCPNCQTMNASDKPKCMEYLACYLSNNCNPVLDPCGQQDGICGVNTIGGGNAPRDAAIVTYMCACP